MNADIPVIVIGAICTAQTGAVLWVVLRLADRLRLAAPPKASTVQQSGAEAATVQEIAARRGAA